MTADANGTEGENRAEADDTAPAAPQPLTQRQVAPGRQRPAQPDAGAQPDAEAARRRRQPTRRQPSRTPAAQPDAAAEPSADASTGDTPAEPPAEKPARTRTRSPSRRRAPAVLGERPSPGRRQRAPDPESR